MQGRRRRQLHSRFRALSGGRGAELGRGPGLGLGLALGLVTVVGATGCGTTPSTDVTNRLWVSSVPTSPRQGTTAFAIVGTKGRNLGVLHSGSVYESRHQMFTWTAQGEKAKLVLLQSNEAHAIRIETCKPSRGFDRCVMLQGDPSGAVRYQSRKRWALRGRSGQSASGEAAPSFEQIVSELAAEDPDLATMVINANADANELPQE